MPRSRLPRMKHKRRTLNPTNSNPSNSTIPELKELELLLDKLKIQFYFCFGVILFTILAYLIISSKSQCCELPFQESSCVVRSVLPLTNHSTLAEEVDEFITSARGIAFNLHEAVEIPTLPDRQKTLEITDYKLWQLIEQHSVNLAAFGVIKREDERMEELEEAVNNGYMILIFGYYLIGVMAAVLGNMSETLKLTNSDGKQKRQNESNDSRNARQKKMKKQIPIFYMATLICFMVQMGLYAAFFISQYYIGHCPVYGNLERKRGQTLKSGEKYLAISFSDYHTFADKLQLTLDFHLEELNKTIQSPNLEIREIGWKYEYYAIEAAFKHHLELKQYHVDRNVMPREISYGRQDVIIGMPRSRLPRMKQERRTLNPKNSHPSNSTIPELKVLELLLDKLKIQFYFCFGGILFTILGYLAISSNSQCCKLPFQESSCVVRSVLPLTNHSTLAEEVDEFITSARTITFNLHGVIEIPSLTDRQKALEITDYKLWQLIEQHSANLAAFGATKREDERMEELEVAIGDGYGILFVFSWIGACSAEEMQKKVKRQIPVFYIATLVCFMVQLGFYAAFFKSQSSAGHCPLYSGIEDRRDHASKRGETYLPKSFSDYHTFAEKLQLSLDFHLEELNKTIQSPILEIRELGWKYEYYALEAAFRHHDSELKQYLVDGKVMPRKISYAPRNIFFLIVSLFLNVFCIACWAAQEGSVWQPWQFIQFYF